MACNFEALKRVKDLFFNDNLYLQIVDSSKIENVIEKYTDIEKLIILNKFSDENHVFINFMTDENLNQSLSHCWDNNKIAFILMENRNGKQVFRFETENFNNKKLFYNKIYQAAIVYLSLLSTQNTIDGSSNLNIIKPFSDAELLLHHEIKNMRKQLTDTLTI
jgi:hypothetical protein